MNTLIVAAIRCSLMFVLSTLAYAGNAQWNLNPTSGDWNTAGNWTPMTVPNGPRDIATFALSNTTNVSISANTEVNGITFTPAATNPYSISVSPGLTLALSGTGITNNSGIAQVLLADPLGDEGGQILFTNSASAGNAGIISYGLLQFSNSSTAGSSSISNGGEMDFHDTSTAGAATITNFSFSNSTFWDNSSAGSANIGVFDASILQFADRSSAGNATISTLESSIVFFGSSTAGSASILVTGAFLDFFGSSKGGTAQIELSFSSLFQRGAVLEINGHNFPGVTIGSIEGDESSSVFLGSNNLTVGSNDLSTTFSGVIEDNGSSGSLIKIGTGTLDLKGASTYTGQTNINGGVLQVDGSTSSNTFVNHKGALAGGGTVYGNVTNYGGDVSPGDPLGVPGVLNVSNYTQTPSASLVIKIAGADAGQASVLNVLGNANLNGSLDPELVNGFVPDIDQSFTFLGYASVTGSFSHIQHQVFDNGRKRWSLVYQPTGAALVVINNGSDRHGHYRQ